MSVQRFQPCDVYVSDDRNFGKRSAALASDPDVTRAFPDHDLIGMFDLVHRSVRHLDAERLERLMPDHLVQFFRIHEPPFVRFVRPKPELASYILLNSLRQSKSKQASSATPRALFLLPPQLR